MTGKPAPVFLHRPEGVDALPIGGGGPGPYKPVRAVLQTAHGGVLVRSVVRQPDGAFTGEVYGIMPHEPSVARGERVRFEESQIFSFKGGASIDSELTEMARVFHEGWDALETRPGRDRSPGPAATEAGAQARAGATRQSAEASVEMSVGEAMAVPCPAGRGEREKKEAAVENDFDKPGPGQRASAHTAPHHEPIACMECGAILPPPPPPADPAAASHATRIACPRCGRINDIAEAEAVDLHRQRPHA